MSCHDQSCGSHDHSHSKGGCGCSCHSCNCCSKTEESCCDKAKRLLEIADLAWMEALKEKIKQNILASDHQIDEIAKVVGEANRDRWHLKMAKAKAKENYESRLSEITSKSCCSTDKKNNK